MFHYRKKVIILNRRLSKTLSDNAAVVILGSAEAGGELSMKTNLPLISRYCGSCLNILTGSSHKSSHKVACRLPVSFTTLINGLCLMNISGFTVFK